MSDAVFDSQWLGAAVVFEAEWYAPAAITVGQGNLGFQQVRARKKAKKLEVKSTVVEPALSEVLKEAFEKAKAAPSESPLTQATVTPPVQVVQVIQGPELDRAQLVDEIVQEVLARLRKSPSKRDKVLAALLFS